MLLRAPEGWPQPVVAVVAMVVLAVLDLGGSLAAKEAVDRRSIGLALTGAAMFLAVFWVYISSLEVAELSAVTFGWIVILQIGVVLVDRFHYHASLARGTWLAIAVLLAAQAYLIMAPAPTPSRTGPPASTERLEQGVQAADDDPGQLGDAEGAEPDHDDQQGLSDGLVSGVRAHVYPQRQPESLPVVTTQG
jgi:hypothetical protein